MKMDFPSREFDDAVAAACHGVASDEQLGALHELLRRHPGARDDYILRVELHSRLASDPELLFVPAAPEALELPGARGDLAPRSRRRASIRAWAWASAIAACLAVLAVAGWWQSRLSAAGAGPVATSKAVAMLNQAVDARWSATPDTPRLGAPLDPGWLKLESGMVQVVFYSGARVAIEGPAELQLISSNHASCRLGKIAAEVPPEARGFRLDTPEGVVTDLGTSFGLEVKPRGTELHVFKGSVTLQTNPQAAEQMLREGAGAVLERPHAPRLIPANRAAYLALLNVREKSVAAEALRLERWRAASDQLNRDPSLRVRFDFERSGSLAWQLHNVAQSAASEDHATIVGCQFGKGRWPEKRALEFQGVSDRVRLNVPGELSAVTLAAWVRVQGLDRKLNSLFMCDGLSPGTLHWLIRKDGVLGLTIVGPHRGVYQIAVSPSVVTLDKFGMWLHLAVVVDGPGRRVVQYVNGRRVAEVGLQIAPPYRIGTAELGNWNGEGFPENDPFMIRNFSGAMDDFCLFGRALEPHEIQALYAEGRPDLEAVARRD